MSQNRIALRGFAATLAACMGAGAFACSGGADTDPNEDVELTEAPVATPPPTAEPSVSYGWPLWCPASSPHKVWTKNTCYTCDIPQQWFTDCYNGTAGRVMLDTRAFSPAGATHVAICCEPNQPASSSSSSSGSGAGSGSSSSGGSSSSSGMPCTPCQSGGCYVDSSCGYAAVCVGSCPGDYTCQSGSCVHTSIDVCDCDAPTPECVEACLSG